MLYLAIVYSDVEKDPSYQATSNTSPDVETWICNILDVTSLSETNSELLSDDSPQLVAYSAKSGKDLNFPVILEDTHNTEAVIKGDCVICKRESGDVKALSLAEKDSLVASVKVSQTKIKEINEKAEKSSVECMRKLCEA